MDFINGVLQENWTGILVAVFCGSFIGLERQLRGKAAGMRTSALICLGTFTFIQLGIVSQTESADPTRVLGQVITGIGFLGAGVIMTRGGTVAGVTSASVVWVLAAVGAAVGFERYAHAVILTLVTVALLTGINWLETNMSGLRKEVHYDADPRLRDRDNG